VYRSPVRGLLQSYVRASIMALLPLASACAQASPPTDRLEGAVLSVLQAIEWAGEICRTQPCSVVRVDTAIYKTNTVQLVPPRDSVVFHLSAERLSTINTERISFVSSAPYDRRSMASGTVHASVGFSGAQPLDSDSLLTVVQVITAESSWPMWVYASIRWTGRVWRVERIWSREP